MCSEATLLDRRTKVDAAWCVLNSGNTLPVKWGDVLGGGQERHSASQPSQEGAFVMAARESQFPPRLEQTWKRLL